VVNVGRLLASGRDADIFEFGPDLVLRRSRAGRSLEPEARVMEYLRVHGYPVPAVEELTDNQTSLIMERIHGPSMVDYLSRHPWMILRQGHVLAALHHQLHEVPPPDYLPVVPVGQGDAFLHMDLHPLNVMMGPNGPVVIDWTNAGRGDPSVDVALAYLLMSSGQIPTNRLEGLVVGVGRRVLTRSFLSQFDRESIEGRMRESAEWKAQDKNMSAQEIQSMRRIAEKADPAGHAT
jgi:aminoglycoside phosphotransferase (APT) family kinase protein